MKHNLTNKNLKQLQAEVIATRERVSKMSNDERQALYGRSVKAMQPTSPVEQPTAYTDPQLKQALAKMLPETLGVGSSLFHKGNGKRVLELELLGLCWLVQETLSCDIWDDYIEFVSQQVHSIYNREHLLHATWQQRVTALAKVKGIELR
jgi:hypothetical protein